MTQESNDKNEQVPPSEHGLPSTQEITERANEAIENVTALQQQAREQVEIANHTAITFIQDKPIIALGLAFGVGYLLGAAAKRRWII